MFENEYFYYESTRKVTIVIGSLFNSIRVNKPKSDGVQRLLKVGISNAQREAFIQKLNKKEDDEKINAVLPRLSFEVGTPIYDSDRESDFLQQVIHKTPDGVSGQFYPVPYTFPVELNIWTKTLNDRAQIVEQILPFFRPDFTVAVKDVKGLEQVTDIKITLTGNESQDSYESNLLDKRIINHTITFDVEYYIFPPVKEGKIIREVLLNLHPQLTDEENDEKGRFILNPFMADKDDDFTIDESWS